MKYLVDANILSEATKPIPSPIVLKWLEANQNNLIVNPIVLGELQYGILALPDGKRKTKLLSWFARGLKALHSVDIDGETADRWAKLLAELRAQGVAMPLNDSLIAASALQHRLVIATRNTRDFAQSGVTLVNPFEEVSKP